MSDYRWAIRQYDSEEKLDAGHSKWLKGWVSLLYLNPTPSPSLSPSFSLSLPLYLTCLFCWTWTGQVV